MYTERSQIIRAMFRSFSFPSCAMKVANQEGRYLARLLNKMAVEETSSDLYEPFRYRHFGSLAYVGGDKAVIDFSGEMSGQPRSFVIQKPPVKSFSPQRSCSPVQSLLALMSGLFFLFTFSKMVSVLPLNRPQAPKISFIPWVWSLSADVARFTSGDLSI